MVTGMFGDPEHACDGVPRWRASMAATAALTLSMSGCGATGTSGGGAGVQWTAGGLGGDEEPITFQDLPSVCPTIICFGVHSEKGMW